METNEIMLKETTEIAEIIAEPTRLINGFKVVAGIGLTVLVCGVAYRYVVKPAWAKIKARREQGDSDGDIDYHEAV